MVFKINAAGDLIKITDPNLTIREFTYDARHRLIQQRSKRGQLTPTTSTMLPVVM